MNLPIIVATVLHYDPLLIYVILGFLARNSLNLMHIDLLTNFRPCKFKCLAHVPNNIFHSSGGQRSLVVSVSEVDDKVRDEDELDSG